MKQSFLFWFVFIFLTWCSFIELSRSSYASADQDGGENESESGGESGGEGEGEGGGEGEGEGEEGPPPEPIPRIYNPCGRDNSPIYWKSYKCMVEAIEMVYQDLGVLYQCFEVFGKVYKDTYPTDPELPIEIIFNIFRTYIHTPYSADFLDERISMKDLISLLKRRLSHKKDTDLVAYVADENDREIDQKTHQLEWNMDNVTNEYLSHPPLETPIGSIESKESMLFICDIIAFICFNFRQYCEEICVGFRSFQTHFTQVFASRYNGRDNFDNKLQLKKNNLRQIVQKILSRVQYVLLLSHQVIVTSENFSEGVVVIPGLVLQHIDPSLLGRSDLRKNQDLSIHGKISTRTFSRPAPLSLNKVDLKIIFNGSTLLLFSEHGSSIGSIIDDLLIIYEISLTETIKEQFSKLIALGQHQCVGSLYLLSNKLLIVEAGLELGIVYRLHDSKGFTLNISDKVFLDGNRYQIDAIKLILSLMSVSTIKAESIEEFMLSESGREQIKSLPAFGIGNNKNKNRDGSFPGSSLLCALGQLSILQIRDFGSFSEEKVSRASLNTALCQTSDLRKSSKQISSSPQPSLSCSNSRGFQDTSFSRSPSFLSSEKTNCLSETEEPTMPLSMRLCETTNPREYLKTPGRTYERLGLPSTLPSPPPPSHFDDLNNTMASILESSYSSTPEERDILSSEGFDVDSLDRVFDGLNITEGSEGLLPSDEASRSLESLPPFSSFTFSSSPLTSETRSSNLKPESLSLKEDEVPQLSLSFSTQPGFESQRFQEVPSTPISSHTTSSLLSKVRRKKRKDKTN